LSEATPNAGAGLLVAAETYLTNLQAAEIRQPKKKRWDKVIIIKVVLHQRGTIVTWHP
jgi:hypothetical protein